MSISNMSVVGLSMDRGYGEGHMSVSNMSVVGLSMDQV